MNARMKPTERFGDDREILARELAASIAEDLAAAIRERGGASLVVSGGSTPKPLFRALRTQELDWAKVTVTLADERWVPPEDTASNEGMLRRELLRDRAADARFISLVTGDATPEAGSTVVEERLREMSRPFDVVVLGMGGDGHTASLFPDAPELPAGLDPTTERLCLAVRPPSASEARISLTLPALLDARRIVLHITDEEKRAVYERALGDGPVEALPIRAILRGGPERLEVYWAP